MKKISLFLVLLLISFASLSAQNMLFSDTSRRGVPYAKDPHVIAWNGHYLMYYSIPDGNGHPSWGIGVAKSKNLTDWQKIGEVNPLPNSELEKRGICAPCALVVGDKIHLFYQTYGNGAADAICHSTSDDGINFERDSSNPIFSAKGDWSCGRAIDAEVYKFKKNYFLYFATRDKSYTIQKQGVAIATDDSDFSRTTWSQWGDQSILEPELKWEGKCIEGASIIRRGGKLYMFYAGNYNNAPQQVGVAVSKDGVKWKRLFEDPFVRNGQKGEWNHSESGHPHIFEDKDGRSYLFYQGNNDNGKSWYITQQEVIWKKGKPILK